MTPKLLFVLVVLAGSISAAIGWLVDLISEWPGWSFTGVSALGCFGLLYWLFDRFAWRWQPLRRVLLVPDINGEWECSGKTTLKDAKPVDFDWQADITIRQSWSRMTVYLKTANSESKSVAASLYHEPGRGYRLMYPYDNSPGVGVAERELRRHSGQCDLMFAEDCKSANGSYFTNRDRLAVGTMCLVKKKGLER